MACACIPARSVKRKSLTSKDYRLQPLLCTIVDVAREGLADELVEQAVQEAVARGLVQPDDLRLAAVRRASVSASLLTGPKRGRQSMIYWLEFKNDDDFCRWPSAASLAGKGRGTSLALTAVPETKAS